ncbi:MAG: amidase [Anaerolineales bacterium]|nr:amidase [Anaerolineales bacterium]
MTNKNTYDLRSINLPRMSGWLLRISTALMESPLTRWLIMPNMLKSAGIGNLRQMHFEDLPTFLPLHRHPPESVSAPERGGMDVEKWLATVEEGSTPFTTIRDYARAYRAGEQSPEQVAQSVISAIAESDQQNPPLRAFIACLENDVLAQARESTRRFKQGAPLSPLDGVPIAIKDEVDMIPYPTTVGTKFLLPSPASKDATAVARLRAAGALLIGKTNMHEIGLGTTGLNLHHGTVRNPYDPGRHSGGSSSGSAAAVAAGLCPAAVGADGGGSIRIPSAFCGLVGLKPTYGRVSEYGAFPTTPSLGHLGPIAASVVDAALVYGIIAGIDPEDTNTFSQPPISLPHLAGDHLSDLSLGIYHAWFNHANPEVVKVCESLLQQFEQVGIRIKEVDIPELEAMRLAHLVIIATEATAALEYHYSGHRKDLSLEMRSNLAMAYSLNAQDYQKAQRIRTRAIQHFKQALVGVDAILTPVSGIQVPPIRNDALKDGEADMRALSEMLRFNTPANLTGLPAISFPAGYDSGGLPVGMQAIAAPWREDLLLELAFYAEKLVDRKVPAIHYEIL